MWANPVEKNSFSALAQAINNDLGIETDVRDCDGVLVISHDPPSKDKVIGLDDLFSYYANSEFSPCLALNIKSDGLQDQLLKKIKEYGIENYFVFDMSVPDTLSYIKREMPFAARISEYEQEGKLLEMAQFVWLDGFGYEWYSIEFINQILARGKKIAIVSPELHGRPHSKFWSLLRPLAGNENLYLCTDFIKEAMEFFNVNKD
jgi:glycerophosphoryl diester phosphodiesterase